MKEEKSEYTRRSLVLYAFIFSITEGATLFPHFSLGVLPRLAWGQRSCSASLVFAVVGLSQCIEEVGVVMSGSVGIEGHAVAETPTEATRALRVL